MLSRHKGTMLWVLMVTLPAITAINLPPEFTADMNQHLLEENTPVGSPVYTLQGMDPEGSEVRFGIEGTDTFKVDPQTGVVTVAKNIDRESQVGF